MKRVFGRAEFNLFMSLMFPLRASLQSPRDGKAICHSCNLLDSCMLILMGNYKSSAYPGHRELMCAAVSSAPHRRDTNTLCRVSGSRDVSSSPSPVHMDVLAFWIIRVCEFRLDSVLVSTEASESLLPCLPESVSTEVISLRLQ